jgi:tetratricopeptide (TPR) repeat protein
MPYKNLSHEQLAALNAELKQYGINEQQIIDVINSVQISGDNNIVFQDSNHNTFNITLPLDNDAMLTRLAKRISQTLQPQQIAHYIGDIGRNDAAFFGRAIEKEGIIQDLKRHKKVLLQGMGGMGKTTLAYNICQAIGDQYDHVIWTNLQNANPDASAPLRDHLLYKSTQLHKNLNLSDVLQAEQDETQKWEILMDKIGKLGTAVLWVIDNAQQNDAAILNKLPHNCQIILTARGKIGDIPECEIDELDMINALHLFKHYYKRPDKDNSIIEVCERVGYHALSIELLAKTLNELPNKDTSFLLEQLDEKGLNIERQRAVWSNYAERKIYLNECLLIAFDLGKLSTQTTLHPLLRFFCLMPYQYIAYDLICQINQTPNEAAEDILLDHLEQLTDLGWIKQALSEWDNTTQESWQMHPVIQDMVNQQLGKDAEQEGAICVQIHDKSAVAYKQNEITAQLWRPFLERLVKYVTAQNEAIAAIYTVLALLNQAMGNYAIALQQQKTALQIAEQILPAQHPDLASLYLNMGNTYSRLTDYATALNYYEKCRAIREKILPQLHPNLATLYINMSVLYAKQAQLKEAKAYIDKAVAIYRQIVTINHPQLQRALQLQQYIQANL